MTDLEMLSNRVHEMERKFRRIKQVLLLVGVVAVTGTIMGQERGRLRAESPQAARVLQPEEQVRAHEFTLVDMNGKDRASLVADGAGSVFLILFDKNGKSRVDLSVTNEGPSLTFRDPSGQARAVLGSTTLVGSHVSDNGVAERAAPSSIVLFDKNGKLISRTP
jgi:hypothetical protein